VLDEQRDFVGKRGLLGRTVSRQLTGLALVEKNVMRRHQKVRCADGEGEITSGGFSPTLNRSIALARLPAQAMPGETVAVNIRDSWLHARVVKPPFVRHGKIVARI